MTKEIINKDLQKGINRLEITVDQLAQATAKGFASVDKRFDNVDKRFDSVDKRFYESKSDINQRFNRIEANMVTKDYLDEKLADLRGDLVVLIRKEDNKVKVLVDVLHQKKVLTDKETQTILSLEPFSKQSL